ATPAPGQSLQKVLESVDGMIGQLRTQVISDQELRRAKNQAEFACFSERDGPYRTGFHLGYFDSIQSWKSAYSWPERLRTVTAADILRVSRKYLVPENRVVGFLASSIAQKTPPVQNAAPTAPKQNPPKPPQSATILDLAKQKLVAYKGDDSAISPEAMRHAGDTKQILIAQAKTSKASAKATAKPAAKSTTKPDPKVTSTAQKPTDKASSKKVETSPTAKKTDGSPAVKKADPSAIKTDATKGGAPAPGRGDSAATALKKEPVPKATAATRSPRPPVGSSLQSGQYTRKVLKNGLTVIAFESRLSPIVQICGAVRAGEVYEPTEKAGLSSVVAHSLNYGTPRATKIQLQTVQEDMGLPPSAMLKFEPGLEQITFQTRCLAKDLVQQLGIVAESLSSPALAEADLEKAKQDAINGLKKSDETVAARVNRALMRSLLAPNSPHFPTDPSEKAKVIEALKISEIKDFYTSNISPGSTMMVIAGDIDGEQAIRAAEAVFESWQSNARIATEPGVVQSARRSLKVSVPIKDRTQTMICIGKLIKTAPGDRDFHNLAIADCALTNHPIFSRLVQRDNDEAVMATSMSSEEINSRFQSLGGLTSWSLIVPTEPDAVSKAVTTVNTELKNFVKNGLTLNEIQEVKRYLAGVVSVRYMPNLSVAAKSVLDAALERSEGDFVGELLLKIANADPENINRFIRNVFRPDQSTLVVAGDKQAIRQVQPRSDSEMRAPASDSVAPANGAAKSSSAN
ncbi:MAG: insulinase family protein, partial [Leptolyngbya sp.]|nr:insulinase family protein [Candidatus Melainabacteria bacterium]